MQGKTNLFKGIREKVPSLRTLFSQIFILFSSLITLFVGFFICKVYTHDIETNSVIHIFPPKCKI